MLDSSRCRVVEHLAAVVAEPILDLGRRDPVGVGELGIEGHAILGLREVFADHHHAGGSI